MVAGKYDTTTLTNDQVSYLETALWSSTDNADEQGGAPLDENYGIDDIDSASLTTILDDWEAFKEANSALIAGLDLNQVAHDFWLTRNRHGAGFWDGDYEQELGEKLTELSHAYGEVDIYVGDDGKLYV